MVAAASVPENRWQGHTVQLKHCAVGTDRNKYIRGHGSVRVLEHVHNWNSREAFDRVANERSKTFSNIVTIPAF